MLSPPYLATVQRCIRVGIRDPTRPDPVSVKKIRRRCCVRFYSGCFCKKLVYAQSDAGFAIGAQGAEVEH